MTWEEFADIKDNILQLTGRELATKLKAPASSVSAWSKPIAEGGREIPDYIAELLGFLVREKLGTMTFHLTASDISGIIRLAAARGLSFEGLLLSLIRKAIAPGAVPFPGTYETPDYTAARKIAEPATKPPSDNLKGKPA